MEISLEKIELVKDRTGVSYREAKEALEKVDGNVVDAIISIEGDINITPRNRAESQTSDLVDRVKELLRKGNVSKVVVKKGDDTILNIPVNLGILGVVLFPWATLITSVVALGTKCSIEIVKVDGEVVHLSEKATKTISDVRGGASVLADDLKEKGSGAYSRVREKAADIRARAQEEADRGYYDDDDYFNFDDSYDDVEETASKAEDVLNEAKEKAEDAAEEVKEKASGVLEKVEGHAEEAAEAVKETVEEIAEEAEDRKETFRLFK